MPLLGASIRYALAAAAVSAAMMHSPRSAVAWPWLRLGASAGVSGGWTVPGRPARDTGPGAIVRADIDAQFSPYLSALVSIGWEGGGKAERSPHRVNVETGLRYTLDWGDWVPWMAAGGGARLDTSVSSGRSAGYGWGAVGLEFSLSSQQWVGVEFRQTFSGPQPSGTALIGWRWGWGPAAE